MSIPKLSAEQRANALQKAQQMRTERMILRQELLESLPQVGKITAAKLMAEIGIDEVRRVQGLGSRQKADLLQRFAD